MGCWGDNWVCGWAGDWVGGWCNCWVGCWGVGWIGAWTLGWASASVVSWAGDCTVCWIGGRVGDWAGGCVCDWADGWIGDWAGGWETTSSTNNPRSPQCQTEAQLLFPSRLPISTFKFTDGCLGWDLNKKKLSTTADFHPIQTNKHTSTYSTVC
jgi:hypothetical protein